MKKIFIAEDDKDLIEVMKLNLEKYNYEVDYAYDGEEALKKILVSSPDVIIIDLMMPKIDGVTLSKMIKNNEKLKDVPIIILTGKLGTKELFEIDKNLQIAAFFYKPVLISEMLETIKKLLK